MGSAVSEPELPPLESDDPEWVAARWRAWASGRRFGDDGKPRNPRPSGNELRGWHPGEALVDVYCETRHVLRVAVVDGAFRVGWNFTSVKGGHWSLNDFVLSGLTTVAVECRCGHPHKLSSLALQRRAARVVVPGKPKKIGVADAESHPGY